MALIPPERPYDEAEDLAEDLAAARRRKAVRYGVPLAVAGLAAATIGLVPALAQDDGPSADDVTAKELIAKALASEVESVDGTVKVSTDLGLPSLPFGGMGGGEGADLSRLLSGDTKLQVAADGPEKQRVTVEGSDGDHTVVRNGADVWTFGGDSDEVSHSTLTDAPKGNDFELPKDLRDATPQELAERLLKAADDTTDVDVAGTAQVAGQDAYELRLTPKQGESTVRDITVAVDADNGVPLRVALTADDGKPVVDVGFTKVDFAKPDADLFAPPAGAEVTERDLGKGLDSGHGEPFFGEGFGDFGKDGGDWTDSNNDGGHKEGMGELPVGLEDVQVHGEGWGSIAEIALPGDALGGEGAGAALDFFTEKTDAGRVFESRLVNVLIADDSIYVGAVTPEALQAAAGD
ncbi:outer membrane lipoprotein carrier protein LolA [Streptomyces synnematoformans]|uniref:Outer membrane lipoprotein carrier protein LolA n=1 Tax=Streptomyces synnematoformans TaxID=415721 RepID=A0ABP5JKI1_9ACTN